MAKSEEKEREISIFRNVAHSTDPVQRGRAIKKIKKWLQTHPEATLLQYLQIWKPLWMAFWHSDKRAVQQEVAVNLAMLLRDVPEDKQYEWVMGYFLTMQLNWTLLDRIRMDKYMLFVRIFTAELIHWVSERGWSEDAVDELQFVLAVAGPMRGHIGKTEGLPDILDSVPHRLCPSVESSLGLTSHFLTVFGDELIYALSDPEAPPGTEEDKETLELIAAEKARLAEIRPMVLDNIMMLVLDTCAASKWEPVSQPAADCLAKLIAAFPKDAPLDELASYAFAKGAAKSTTIPNRTRLYDLVKQCEDLGGKVDPEVMQEAMRAQAQSQEDGAKAARIALEEESGVKLNRRERARLAREAREAGDDDDVAPQLVDTKQKKIDTDAATAALLAKFGAGGADISDDEDEDEEDQDEEMDGEGFGSDDDEEDDVDEIDLDGSEIDVDAEDESEEEEEEEEEEVVPEPPSKRLRSAKDSVVVQKDHDAKKKLQQQQQQEQETVVSPVSSKKDQKKAAAAAEDAALVNSSNSPSASPSAEKRKTPSAPTPEEAQEAPAKKTKQPAVAPTETAPAAESSPSSEVQKSGKRSLSWTDKHSVLDFNKRQSSVMCRDKANNPVSQKVMLMLTQNLPVNKEELPPLPAMDYKPPRSCYRTPTPLSTTEAEFAEMDAVTKAYLEKAREIQRKREQDAIVAQQRQAALMRLANLQNRMNEYKSGRQKSYKQNAGKPKNFNRKR